MKFTKMQGAGNDFIIINNMEEQLPASRWSELALRLCPRRTSLGADGLMIVERAEHGGDFRMVFYNSDGTMGEMCGNGARCISRYGYEHGLSGEAPHVETTAGDVYARRCSEREYEIRLNDPTLLRPHQAVSVGGQVYDCGYVELGDPGLPHAILLHPDWDQWDRGRLFALGKALRRAEVFPRGANVTFVKQLGAEHFAIRTFERGVEDFTLACGTGCGSTAAILALRGMSAGKNVQLEAEGGTLHVSLQREAECVHDILLRGPTCVVASGEIGEIWEA